MLKVGVCPRLIVGQFPVYSPLIEMTFPMTVLLNVGIHASVGMPENATTPTSTFCIDVGETGENIMHPPGR